MSASCEAHGGLSSFSQLGFVLPTRKGGLVLKTWHLAFQLHPLAQDDGAPPSKLSCKEIPHLVFMLDQMTLDVIFGAKG